MPAEPDDPSRTGTLWLGATGVAMLLAAATALTAVRWGDIGQTAKLGGLVALTFALLVGGRKLQPAIPLTGRAIFHLGAFLVPLDMAAVALLADRTWEQALLLTSVTAAGAWAALSRIEPSPALRWATVASVPLLAAGIAAVSSVAMPLVLAVAACLAVAAWWPSAGTGISRAVGHAATAWTLGAGLLPLSALLVGARQLVALDLDDTYLTAVAGSLGFLAADRWQLVAASAIATLAAGCMAGRRPSLGMVWITVVLAAVAGVLATATAATFGAGHVVVAALALSAQLLLLALRHDPVWKPARESVGPLVELTACLALIITLVDATVRGPAPLLVAAAMLLGLGWLTADLRRVLEPSDWLVALVYGSGWGPTTIAVPAAVITAAVAAGAGAVVGALTLLACGVWAVCTGRPYGSWMALVAAMLAMLVAPAGWWLVAIVVVAMALQTAAARLSDGLDDEISAMTLAAGAALAGLSLVSALVGVVPDEAGPPVAAALLWLAGLFAASRIAPHTWIGRGAAIAVALVAWSSTSVAGLAACAVLLALACVDWWRSREVAFEVVGAAALALAILPAAGLMGFGTDDAGLIAAGIGVVATGLMLAVSATGERALGLFAVLATLLGVAHVGAVSSSLLGATLLLSATSLALFGAASRNRLALGAAVLVGLCGVWIQLATWQVDWLEAYLAIPALAAAWAGWSWHRATGVTTWVTHAPTIAIYGGVAVADRVLGGSAWHSVIAGAVAIAALLAGATWRLVGPLVTGTGLLTTVVVYEAVATGARLPTWAWLAAGGTILLGAAVALERKETTPLEQGQRIVQILATRFN